MGGGGIKVELGAAGAKGCGAELRWGSGAAGAKVGEGGGGIGGIKGPLIPP